MAVIIIAERCGENEVKEVVKEFDENEGIDNILYYATSAYAFRIPHEEDRQLWNKILNEEWGGLDDVDYFKFDKPYAYDDKWVCLEFGGHFSPLQELINDYKFVTKMLIKVKEINGGRY